MSDPLLPSEFATQLADLINQFVTSAIDEAALTSAMVDLYTAASLSTDSLALQVARLVATVKGRLMFGPATVVTAAATVDLGSMGTHLVHIDGETDITDFGSSASVDNPIYILQFDDVLNIVHDGVHITLPSGADIETYSGYMGLAQWSGADGWFFFPFAGAQGPPGSVGSYATPRISAQASTATLAWNSNNYDQFCINSLAVNLTIPADAGSPQDGQKVMFRIRDNGTARTVTWASGSAKSFQEVGATLPSPTVPNKFVYVGVIYNAAASRWDALPRAQQL